MEAAWCTAAVGECLLGQFTDKEPKLQQRWEESAQHDNRCGLGPKALVSLLIAYCTGVIRLECWHKEINAVSVMSLVVNEK